MNEINFSLIGHIVMFLACILMITSNLPKNKDTSLKMQIVQIFMMSAGNVLLGSWPGCITNIFAGIRHTLSYKNKLNTPFKIILSIAAVSFSLLTNNIGVFIIFPVLSFILFIAFMNTPNHVQFKILILISNILWIIHDLYIESYVSVAFNILGIITAIIGIYRLKKKSS